MATDKSCPFNVNPLAQSQPIRNGTIFNLNYTCQDFWSMKTRLVDYIRQNFPDKFNDFVESDLAIMLIENQAFLADLLSFKIDQIANEPFIDTVTELENAFRHVQTGRLQAAAADCRPQPVAGDHQQAPWYRNP
jgi:hypothetical protein